LLPIFHLLVSPPKDPVSTGISVETSREDDAAVYTYLPFEDFRLIRKKDVRFYGNKAVSGKGYYTSNVSRDWNDIMDSDDDLDDLYAQLTFESAKPVQKSARVKLTPLTYERSTPEPVSDFRLPVPLCAQDAPKSQITPLTITPKKVSPPNTDFQSLVVLTNRALAEAAQREDRYLTKFSQLQNGLGIMSSLREEVKALRKLCTTPLEVSPQNVPKTPHLRVGNAILANGPLSRSSRRKSRATETSRD
jgi:hypothetical protein